MLRTTIMLPTQLKMKATEYAQLHGLSLGQVIRKALRQLVAEQVANKADPFFADDATFAGSVPADLSSNVDKYLYDE